MTPQDLAKLHPQLFHVTRPEAVEGIRRNGLLPPVRLLDLYGADAGTRSAILARRATSIPLAHPTHGRAVISDNGPLHDSKLADVLDDGLTPDDWHRMLAERVFFWVRQEDAARLRGAKLYRSEPRVMLVLDTASLVATHAERVEMTPINTGATLHTPPRRGLSTFAPLLSTDYDAWKRSRRPLVAGKARPAADKIKEVTVRDGVPDLMRHILEVVPLAPEAGAA